MPWTARDAYRHTKRAATPGAQAKWAKIANSALEQYGDEARAIRVANAAVAGESRNPRRRKGVSRATASKVQSAQEALNRETGRKVKGIDFA